MESFTTFWLVCLIIGLIWVLIIPIVNGIKDAQEFHIDKYGMICIALLSFIPFINFALVVGLLAYVGSFLLRGSSTYPTYKRRKK